MRRGPAVPLACVLMAPGLVFSLSPVSTLAVDFPSATPLSQGYAF